MTQTNTTKKITAAVLTTVSEEDQAVLLTYVNKGLSYQDAKDILSDDALTIIYGDTHVSNPKEKTMKTAIEKDIEQMEQKLQEHQTRQQIPTAIDAITAEPWDGLDRDAMLKLFNSRKYKKAQLALLLANKIITEREFNSRMSTLEDQMKQLQTAIDSQMKMKPAQQPTQQKPAQQQSNFTQHELEVFQFWRDIGWSKHLRLKQKQWAVTVAKHVTFKKTGKSQYLVGWDYRFYKTDRQSLRRVMKSWLAAAVANNLVAEMKPTGVLITFK